MRQNPTNLLVTGVAAKDYRQITFIRTVKAVTGSLQQAFNLPRHYLRLPCTIICKNCRLGINFLTLMWPGTFPKQQIQSRSIASCTCLTDQNQWLSEFPASVPIAVWLIQHSIEHGNMVIPVFMKNSKVLPLVSEHVLNPHFFPVKNKSSPLTLRWLAPFSKICSWQYSGWGWLPTLSVTSSLKGATQSIIRSQWWSNPNVVALHITITN